MKNKTQILDIFLIILIILNCRSVYVHIVGSNFSNYIYLSLIAILSIKFILRFSNRTNFLKVMIVLICYYMYIIIFLLINDMEENLKAFGVRFIIILPLIIAYIISLQKEDIKLIMNYFGNIIIFISILSLTIYLVGPVLKVINKTGIVVIEWGDDLKSVENYLHVYFQTQNSYILGNIFPRNTAIFTEAPMYSFLLIITLTFQKFFLKKNRIKEGIIYASIITTLSITGILFMVIIILADFIFRNKNNLKILCVPLIISIGAIVAITLIEDKSQTISYNTRLDDYSATFYAWLENPFFGNGFLNTGIVKKYMSSFRIYNTGLSSSYMIVLSQGGLYLLLGYIYPFLKAIYLFFKNKKINVISFYIILFLLFFTTAVQYTFLGLFLTTLLYKYGKIMEIMNEKYKECK